MITDVHRIVVKKNNVEIKTNTLILTIFFVFNLLELKYQNMKNHIQTCFVLPSSSSCHPTSVFHLSTQLFVVSLNLLRSSDEQGCARMVHCIMCAVFSVARVHSQVVPPS